MCSVAYTCTCNSVQLPSTLAQDSNRVGSLRFRNLYICMYIVCMYVYMRVCHNSGMLTVTVCIIVHARGMYMYMYIFVY